jgi:biopolymer transport protein ExbB
MSKSNGQGNSFIKAISSIFAAIAIVVAAVVAFLIYFLVMGNPANFQEGNPAGHPLDGNYLGMLYKGGIVVPVLMTTLLVVIIFVFERFIMLAKAKGKGRIDTFVKKTQDLLNANQIDEALAVCDKQRGSVANVMRAGLTKYKALKTDTVLDKDQKVLALQKDLEESTALELPMLSKNLVVLSTLASVCVLIGLFGTVLGMIRAFAALATAGAPDALALATGISEALINTAFGIAGSTLAILFYNYFSNRIDQMTFKIDEAGFSLVQSFASTTK